MNDTNAYLPVVPLELEGGQRARYYEVVRLRREICGDRSRPVTWHDDGSVHPGAIARNNPLLFDQGRQDDRSEQERRRKRDASRKKYILKRKQKT